MSFENIHLIEQETPADAELRTMWMAEIKPFLEAEMSFLKEYGPKAGYDQATVDRFMEYHRQMEKLVWERGGDHIQEFAAVMGSYLQFKENFFITWIGNIEHLESMNHGLATA